MYPDEIPLGRAENLKNKRFGKIIALYRVKSPNHDTKWKCQCDCGNYFTTYAPHLKSGKTICCPDCVNKARRKDITNYRFGKLTAIKPVDKNQNGIIWECKCDCGNIMRYTVAALNAGQIKSCGWCTGGGGKLSNLIGKRFGKLVITELGPKTQDGHSQWYCDCDCGNKHILIRHNNLQQGYTSSCGCGTRSIGELKIEQLFKKNNIKFEKEKTFESCRFPDSNYKARFDFFIPQQNYLIEFDGRQHFNINTEWGTDEDFKKSLIRDNFKNQWCKENNIPLIRIPYTHLKKLCIEDLLLESSKFIVN